MDVILSPTVICRMASDPWKKQITACVVRISHALPFFFLKSYLYDWGFDLRIDQLNISNKCFITISRKRGGGGRAGGFYSHDKIKNHILNFIKPF